MWSDMISVPVFSLTFGLWCGGPQRGQMGCNLQIKLGAGGDDWTALQVIKPVQLILCTLHQGGQSSRLNIAELLLI